MDYKFVQLIAYQAPTLDLTAPLPKSSEPTHKAVLSLKNDDAQIRVQRLLDVLNWAVETIPHDKIDSPKNPDPLSNNQSQTLKVFMAPEFYFRATADGYTWNTLTNILECLKLAFSDWRLDHWLIVPGTICTHQDPHPDSVGTEEGKRTFFNTASVIKGGSKGSMTYVHKERRSDIDGVPPSLSDGTQDPKFKPLLGSWEEQKQRIFNVDGITFGLDVCLEHLTQALKRTVVDWPNKEKGSAPNIDVHLVTSCGMDVKHESVAARTGGCVLLCDGKPNTSPPWKRSAAYEVTKQETTDLTKTATLSDVLPIVWQQDVPSACAITQPVSAASWFKQEVVVYKAIKLV
jgi:hypothetical protein